MKKRIISLLLAVVMLFSMVPLASATDSVTIPTVTPTIAAQENWGEANSTVEVNVTITDNPGLLGAVITLAWDEDLVLESAYSGAAFQDLTYQVPGKFNNRGTNFVWYGNELENVSDGIVLTLNFRIPDTAQEWEQYGVYLTCKSSDFYDQEQNPVNVSTIDGSVLVLTYMPGDVDNDDRISIQDLILLSRYISDGCVTDPEGYNVTLNEKAADVDNSGSINTRDLILISQYISDGFTDPEGYNIILKPSMPRCTHSEIKYVEAKEPTYTETGNIDYWYCNLCDKYFSDAACQNEITYNDTVVPVIDGYAIEYHLFGNSEYLKEKGVSNTNPAYYEPKLGLAKLDNLYAEGFVFEGWYDGEGTNAEKVSGISVGTTGNQVLYARWSPIEYTISYDCGHGKNSEDNVKTYTIEDTIIFSDAELDGYLFDAWLDENGEEVKRIYEGTTGNILLTAKWKTMRCLAHPIDTISNPDYSPKTFIDKGDNNYIFIYYLGYIDNVPFGEIGQPHFHDGAYSYEEKRYTSESTVDSITDVTNKVTERSESWQDTVTVSSELKVECPEVAEAAIKSELSASQALSKSEKSEIGKSVTFSQEKVRSFESSISISKDSPVGWYRFVNFAVVDVFAVITYDANEHTCYITNVNAVRDIFAGWDYSGFSSAFDDDVDSVLPFEFPDEVSTYIDSLTYGTPGLKYKPGTDASGNGIATVVGYDGDAQDVVIPTYYIDHNDPNSKGLRVTGIQESATASGSVFSEKDITSVKLGSYITSVPDYAFYNCKSLNQIIVSDNCTTIGDYAFFGCEKLEYEIPDTITNIGNYAFAKCEVIDSITVTEKVTELGENAFSDCGILDMTIIASNSSVVKAVLGTNATSIKLDLSMLTDVLGDTDIIISDTADYFELYGADNVVSNVSIESYADNSVIKNLSVQNNNGATALLIHSPIATLHTVNISIDNSGNAVHFTNEDVSLAIRETVTLRAGTGSFGILANNITIHSTGDVTGTLNVIGGNGEKTGNAILATGNLSLEGYLAVHAIGGNGVTPSENGGKGSDGAASISADTITININGSFSATGGKGGNGAAGVSYTGWKYANGRHGGSGGAGGNGGEALLCTTLNILNAAKTNLLFTSGNGGSGGNGGKGECSQAYDGNPYTSGNGGTGGQGGAGGTIMNTQSIYVDGKLMSISIVIGSGGKGGNGGDGGDADKYWFQYSTKGKGANGGSGGIAGSLGFVLESFENDAVVTYGTNGNSGTKGKDGVEDYAPSGRPS